MLLIVVVLSRRLKIFLNANLAKIRDVDFHNFSWFLLIDSTGTLVLSEYAVLTIQREGTLTTQCSDHGALYLQCIFRSRSALTGSDRTRCVGTCQSVLGLGRGTRTVPRTG